MPQEPASLPFVLHIALEVQRVVAIDSVTQI
jgi:hypothetical protein